MNYESTTFKRTKQKKLLTSLLKGRSFILFGPRQTGKSTLLEKVFAELPKERTLRYYFQLPSERERIESDPEIILREVTAKGDKEPVYVFIDEIQKIPQVMDLLQFLIDKKKAVLGATGSSARKMKNFGTNWLPGRVHIEHLYPLTWEESALLKNPENLPIALCYGALPGILAEKDLAAREQTLFDYTSLYLEEEIRMEALTRNIPRFSKFLRLAALESGTAPNLSKIGGIVGLTHPTIREYFQILEDTLITHRLDAFGLSRDAVLRSARYYFFDVGVRNTAAGIGCNKGVLTLQFGLLFEHFIILEIISHLQYQAGTELFYWRTRQGEEVDLVIKKGGRLIALEIKATAKPAINDFSGLAAFCRKYSCQEAYLVCQAPRRQKFEHIWVIPWFELCAELLAPDFRNGTPYGLRIIS
ncbi:ATP-binding protein [Candidatus Saganbacteria bacterium]|nr:ATP-binding protein [Candidatus Saganbacteria bacterium]